MMTAVVAAVLVLAASEPFAHLSDKQMAQVMSLSEDRDKSGKVDDQLERTMQNARAQLKRLDAVASREDTKEKDIDDEFDKVTSKAETTFERQKEDFDKKTEGDMDKFERKEEQVEENFKDRSEKDMEKFENALLPDGESSFLQIRDHGDGEFDYKYNIGQDKKKLVGIQEQIQDIVSKEVAQKKRVKERTMKFDAKLDVMADRANKKFDSQESAFESKLEEETDAADKKEEESVDHFKSGMEKDADAFAEALGVDRPTVHHHAVMEDTIPLSYAQKTSFLQTGEKDAKDAKLIPVQTGTRAAEDALA